MPPAETAPRVLPRVLIVSHAYPRFSSDFRGIFIEDLARAYARVGAEVTVLLPYSPEWNRTDEELGPVRALLYRYLPFARWHRVGYGTGMSGDLQMNRANYLLFPFMAFFGTWRLARLFRENRFDVVHAHWAFPNGAMAVVARWLSRSRTPILSSFPGADVRVLGLLGPWGRLLRKIIARSDFLSCNSHDLRDDLVKLGFRADAVQLVIYGVNHRRIGFSAEGRQELRRAQGLAESSLLLLLVGRFVATKGFSTVFRALPKIAQALPEVRVALIGAGPLEAEYRSILEANGCLSRVSFLGYQPTEVTRKYYSACDILLSPARKIPSDGLNVVVPEAMACARPIVASSCGGNELVVFPGKNGFLHGENDPDELADQVIRIGKDPALRAALGQASRELVDREFNCEAIARRYLAVLDRAP